MQSLRTLTLQVSVLVTHIAPAGASAAPVTLADAYASDPAGNLNQYQGFLLQCRMVFTQRPQEFPTDRVHMNYGVGLLRGCAST